MKVTHMFTSINANKLTVNSIVTARIWLGNSKYAYKQTRVLRVANSKLKVSTEGFVFEGLEVVQSEGVVKVMHNGKARRVTFVQVKNTQLLALAAPAASNTLANATQATAKRVLTDAQKARKNELARAKRAARAAAVAAAAATM